MNVCEVLTLLEHQCHLADVRDAEEKQQQVL